MEPTISTVQIEQVVERSITLFESHRDSLNQQLLQLQNLKIVVHNDKSENIMVNLGCDYQAYKTKRETLQFLGRRIQYVEALIKNVDLEIAQALETRRKLGILETNRKEYSESTNDNFQIIDVQEKLDEMGNIIDVKFNDSSGNEIESKRDLSVMNKRSSSEVPNNETPTITSDDLILGLLHDMEVIPNLRPSQQENHHEKGESSENRIRTLEKGETSEGKDLGHRPHVENSGPLYELELIASELGDEGASQDGEEDAEMNESNDEDEDAEEDLSYALLLPRNAKLQNRFWAEVQRLRSNNLEEAKMLANPAEKNAKKAVRFNDTLEIKEIKDVGKDLKDIEHQVSRILKFKENKILFGTSTGVSRTISQYSEPAHEFKTDDVTTDIVEHDVIDGMPVGFSSLDNDEASNSPSDVVENVQKENFSDDEDFNELEMLLKDENMKKTRSKFKSMFAQNPLRRKLDLGTPVKIEAPLDADRVCGDSHSQNASSETFDGRIQDRRILEDDFKELNFDLPNLQNDLDAMVQAYNVGMFDDDMDVSGPVVDKIQDFAILNKMVEGMSSGSGSGGGKPIHQQKQRQQQELLHEGEEEEEYPDHLESLSDSDDGVLRDQIVENEISELDEELNLRHDEVQMSVINQEVSENYYRLRDKIFNKQSAENPEFEPIESVPPESRFKASRINNS